MNPVVAITGTTEDARARPAIERFTQRVLSSAVHGTSYEAARQFAVGVAKRTEAKHGRVDLHANRRLSRHEARTHLRESLGRVLATDPRVQASVGRIARVLVELNPGVTDPALVRPVAEGLVLRRLLDTPHMAEVLDEALARVLAMRVRPEEGRAACEAAVDPSAVARAANGAIAMVDAPTEPYEPATITIYPARLDDPVETSGPTVTPSPCD